MSSIRDLAGEVKLRKLPGDLSETFRKGKFRAVYVASSLEPVARYPGDNRAGRPIKIGLTASFDDKLSAQLLFASPYNDLIILFRVWTFAEDAPHLEKLAKKHVRDVSEKIRRGWAHCEPDLDIDELEAKIYNLARENRIEAWSDGALLKWLPQKQREDMLRAALEGV